jgi:ABC-2 type transport system ATP-binding protein
MTCDRVAMVFAGRTRSVGPLGELLSARVIATEVVVRAGSPLPAPAGARVRQTPEGASAYELGPEADVDAFVKAAVEAGARLLSVTPRRESLEDVFIRQAQLGGVQAAS